jgi:hypothetical protein
MGALMKREVADLAAQPDARDCLIGLISETLLRT